MPIGLAGHDRFIVVTLVISYVTLVVGELVAQAARRCSGPRGGAGRSAAPLDRLATRHPAGDLVAVAVHRPRRAAARRRSRANGREAITEEELRGLVAAHESLTADERRLIDDVFDAGDRRSAR